MRTRRAISIGAAAVLLGLALPAWAAERFPPPDFTTHTLPSTTQPPPRWSAMEAVDVAVLAAALAAATYLALRRRSRWGVFTVMVGALAYFGFYRGGCVCPIGAIQNVALAIFDRSYAIPLGALAFFLLPLAATLLFGRTFCAGVCPLGAIQDLVALKPLRLPGWLNHSLGLLAWAYLGLAVLLAATGAMFAICEYDPFVGFFRLGGPWRMVLLGGVLLAVGVVVARPYCRFLCPYGALFRPLSRLARFHVSITPDRCIQCRLCEDSCPFGAIDAPNAEQAVPRACGKGTLAAMLAAGAALVAGMAALGYTLSPVLARAHADVRLAEQIRDENAGLRPRTEERTDPAFVVRKLGTPHATVFAQADRVVGRFAVGSTLLGAFLGLVAGGKLVSLSIRRRRTDYLADRATCLSCGRCFDACPMDRQWRKRQQQVQP